MATGLCKKQAVGRCKDAAVDVRTTKTVFCCGVPASGRPLQATIRILGKHEGLSPAQFLYIRKFHVSNRARALALAKFSDLGCFGLPLIPAKKAPSTSPLSSGPKRASTGKPSHASSLVVPWGRRPCVQRHLLHERLPACVADCCRDHPRL